ncbi:MAG: sigma-54 dependent transcriptional regulator [Saprospiraceae bacterium]|jgi:two-component system response regulator HydG|nr:sigma-54-dependent Fis family transcriptional regulator [Saprospiraceae bacterium]MBP6445267.1 sigma-54-dependent Fis family transcriptional regulator [Saprospiraceae bacterium]
MIEKSILIVDDDVHILHAAHLFLKRHFYRVEIEKDARQLPYIMNHHQYDLILLDMNFSRNVNTGVEGFEWLDFILDKKPDQKVVLFTAFGDIEMAVRAIKNGASDFLLKPWENDKLLSTITTILNVEPNSSYNSHSEIIGQCPEILKIHEMVATVGPTDANVLILGENGTGKDLLAKEIHKQSKRAKKPFIHTDLGSISESLFESELFGHVKGAFTDARDDRKGRLQEADGGTLFLDEIGNIPLTQQSKLLYALQNGSYIKVGSNNVMKFDARLICATNEDIYKRIEEKTFRQDLLYRINTIEIHLPPLRERGDDVLLLAKHFVRIYAARYNRKITGMAAAFEKKLLTHTWPGNIREIQHAIERAVILTSGNIIREDAFEGQNRTSSSSSVTLNSYQIEEMEKQLVIKMMKKYNGSITDAAKELGITRQALYRRIEKYGI